MGKTVLIQEMITSYDRDQFATSSSASRPLVLTALRALGRDTDCGCRTASSIRGRPKGHTGPAPT